MGEGKANLLRRFLASLVDGLIAAIPAALLPVVIGPLMAGLYYLLKDGLVYELTKREEWRGRSIGKKLFNLQVVLVGGGRVDLVVSAKRNLTLSIGTLLATIPLLGWVVGFVLDLVLTVIEVILVVADPAGRRLGDRWAGTRVVEAASASAGSAQAGA